MIKENYQIRNNPIYCNRTNKDASSLQKHVYLFAEKLTKENNYESIVDIGCGAGEKLISFFPNMNTIGIDYGINYELCKNTYPNNKWLNINLDNIFYIPVEKKSLIICADVIEHLKHPNFLLNFFSGVNSDIIVSTPERDLIHGPNHNGPPTNQSHVQEWNSSEFKQLLEQFNLTANIQLHEKTIIAFIKKFYT